MYWKAIQQGTSKILEICLSFGKTQIAKSIQLSVVFFFLEKMHNISKGWWSML